MAGADVQTLLQRMVALWQMLWADYPAFQNEERPLRVEWVTRTFPAIQELAGEIDRQGLPAAGRYPRPVELAALDWVLSHRARRMGARQTVHSVTTDGQRFMIHLRSLPRPFSRHDTQSGNLAFWLRYHRILPASIRGYTIHIHPLDGKYARMLSEKELRLFLGTFPDHCAPDWRKECKPYYVATTLRCFDPPTADALAVRAHSIRTALQEAQEVGAQVVLFPELAVCAEHRRTIVDWLRAHKKPPFVLVIPGSFHEDFGRPLQKPYTERRNRTSILNGAGQTILDQDKLIPIAVDNVLTAGASQQQQDGVVFEGVGSANALHLLDTPIGLMAVAICRDLLQESSPITDLWEYVAPDWLLVPSMSPGISGHRAAAERLWRMYGTKVLVANQCLQGDFKKTEHGFVSPLEPIRLAKMRVLSYDADAVSSQENRP
ncbi:MAG: hypothetical protein HQL88_09825 [Magnetococcales bacterium]|nr:hypothetical protein [Magnetococcales bacterium]